jgi:hypothetical protein
MAQHNHIEGIDELNRQLRRLEKFPKSKVAKAANAGMKEPLREAKLGAPVDIGNLKRGIKKIREKSPRSKAKVVFSIVFDRAFNPFFQKKVNNPGPGKKDTAYYPVSQEYGFFAKNGRYIPGYRFIRKALENNQIASAKKIVQVLRDEVDKLLR